MIKLLIILLISTTCFAQVSFECTIEQQINGSILETSVFIKSTGVDSLIIGGANFRMNVDTSSLDISIAPLELGEGFWDDNYDPDNYGDQGVGFNFLQGWVSIDIYGEGTGEGVTVPNVKTLVGIIGIPIKTFNGMSGINWRMGGLNRTEIIDLNLIEMTSLGTFIDPPNFILTGLELYTIPTKYKLYQNNPNPFNPTTKIKIELPKNSIVDIKVYNILGQVITTLVNGEKQAGFYEVDFNANSLASGIYFYKIQAGDFFETKKMILLK